MKKILAFSGSNYSKSINSQLIKIAASYVDTERVEVEVISLIDFPAVIFGIDEEEVNGFPETMVKLKDKMHKVDGFIVSSPEHNGSMPAVLKNSLDWVSRQGGKIFNDKPVVFLATSPGFRGGSSVLEHMVKIMPYRGAKIIGSHAVGSFSEKIVGNELTGSDKKVVKDLVAALVQSI
jgi:chromate reductase